MSSTNATTPQFSQAYLDQYSGTQIIVLAIVFITITTLVYFLRLFIHILKRAENGWDDYLLPLALVLQLGQWANALVMVYYGGVGHHVEVVSPPELVVWAKCVYAIDYIYPAAVAFTKFAILALYLRLFGTANRWFYITTWTVIAYNGALWIASLVIAGTQCTPISKVWYPTEPGTCIDTEAYYLAFNPVELAADLVMLFAPIPIIWRLHMEFRRKLSLLVVFSTGIVGIAMCITRWAFFLKDDYLDDPTWSSVTLQTWSCLETSMYFLVACLPGCYVFFARTWSWKKFRSGLLLRRSYFRSTDDGKEFAEWTSQQASGGSATTATRQPAFGGMMRGDELMGSTAGFVEDPTGLAPLSDEDDSEANEGDRSEDSVHVRTDITVEHRPFEK